MFQNLDSIDDNIVYYDFEIIHPVTKQ